jgi:hypothetical protein
MASYSHARSVTETLTGTTADTVTLSQLWPSIQVTNHGSTAIYLRMDGTTAVAGADGAVVVLPNSTRTIRATPTVGTSTAIISLVGDGNQYTIEGSNLDTTASFTELDERLTPLEVVKGARVPLDEAIYDPAGTTVLSTTVTTSADVDATNLAVSFTVPASGEVEVDLEAHGDSGTAGVTYLWHLRDGSGEIADTGAVVTRNNNGTRIHQTITVTGLTPGDVLAWKWGHKMGGAATGRIVCGDPYGSARMTVTGKA